MGKALYCYTQTHYAQRVKCVAPPGTDTYKSFWSDRGPVHLINVKTRYKDRGYSKSHDSDEEVSRRMVRTHLQSVVVEQLVTTLIHGNPETRVEPGDIVVLTPYRGHRRLVARTLENSAYQLSGVLTKTVAMFQVPQVAQRKVQGCQSPVVIVSVGTDFLASEYLSERLVNVMTSRQQFELFIITNFDVVDRLVGAF